MTIYAILAREARTAVVFRRGPSKQVLLLKWNTADDTIEEGQWLKGRIYERRCDLSPDGRLLVYFAGNQKPPYGTWTAVSRPPFLTALALWPVGHAWASGGLFEANHRLLLNHVGEPELAEGFETPKWLRVGKLAVPRGEDGPIWGTRLRRDGWRKAETDVFDRPNPVAPRYTLRMTIYEVGARKGPWYTIDYAVLDEHARAIVEVESEWADWDHNGDLLFTDGGKLMRSMVDGAFDEQRIVADLSDRKFTNRVAPPEMQRWPRKPM